MNTVEALPHTSDTVPAAEPLEAVVIAEAEGEVRTAGPASLPVAAAVPRPVPVHPPALRTRSGLELLAPLREAVGQLVPQLQYQIARLGIAGQAGLAACVAAVVLVIAALLPAHRALQNLQSELLLAQHPLAATRIEEAVPRLVASLPTRGPCTGSTTPCR